MASTFQITAVHTVKPYGSTHEHIEAVRISPGVSIARSTVAADLRNPYGDRYYTYANNTRADVILDDCPHCGQSDYITTTPDWTTANNLLSLPKY